GPRARGAGRCESRSAPGPEASPAAFRAARQGDDFAVHARWSVAYGLDGSQARIDEASRGRVLGRSAVQLRESREQEVIWQPVEVRAARAVRHGDFRTAAPSWRNC